MLRKKGTSNFKVQQNRVECRGLENVLFSGQWGEC
jgi:hypothetical protein